MVMKFLQLLCISLLISQNLISQNFHFKNLLRETGLTSNFITSIHQDGYGYMWFGTPDGLNRYDGVYINTYKYIDGDDTSLINNHITDVLYTSGGTLLVGSIQGLNIFDYKKETFQRIPHFNFTDVRNIVEDTNENIWVVTANGIIFKLDGNLEQDTNFSFVDLVKQKFDLNSSSISVFKYDKDNFLPYVNNKGFYLFNLITNEIRFHGEQLPPPNIPITKVLQVNKSEFWVGTLRGTYVYNNKQISQHFNSGSDKQHLSNQFIRDLKKINDEVWVFTDGGGINIYNSEKNRFTYVKKNVRNEYSLGSDFIATSFIAKDNTLWVGTINNGVSQLIKDNPFTTYKLRGLKNNVRSDYPVSSLFMDSENRIWIGSDGNGLYKLENNQIKHVITNAKINTIPSINEFVKDQLLLGTFKKGVHSYDIGYKKITDQSIINNAINTDSRIHVIGKDQNNSTIIGTDKTLILDKTTVPSTNLLKPKRILDQSMIYSIWNMEQDLTLLGGDSGLFRLVNDEVELISDIPNRIMSIVKFMEDKYWLATNNGVGLIDIETGKVSFYGSDFGLNNNLVCFLIKEDQNNLWLGTSQGVSRFDIEKKEFTNYNFKDGFIDNEFKNAAAIKGDDGRFYFGGLKGVLSFHPDDLDKEPLTKTVIFTKVLVNDQEIEKDNEKVLNDYIAEASQISLEHTQKVLTIGFSTFDFSYPEKTKFLYKLDGFDKEWKMTEDRSLTYMNLNPGDYLLKIKASNVEGVFKDDYSSIQLIVIPAWWQTNWFEILLVVVILTLIFLGNYYVFMQQEAKRKFNFEKESLKKQLDLDEQQLSFFTNLSHEIRTPLSLILSPIEEILNHEQINNKTKANLNLAIKNAKRIKRLTNRGLDFRKTQVKDAVLQAEKVNIISILKELIVDFSTYSNNKGISIDLECEVDEIFLWVDVYMIESILYNLLSNAVKYSFKNGEIIIKVHQEERSVSIKVQDFGVGISKEDLEHIFEWFYQTKDHIEGSGIGLALVKRLVEAHRGTIYVESTVDKGSCFVVKLLKGDKHIGREHKKSVHRGKVMKKNDPVEVSQEMVDIRSVKFSNNTVLIVEDEADLREFLRVHLSNQYIVLTAEHGREALNVLADNTVDLVISDVMMPEMDGFELCKLLKTDLEHQNIPVLLLTAKNSKKDRIEGYTKGADAYIEKPFQLDIVVSRVQNLLDRKQRQENKLLKLLKINIEEDSVSNSEKDFYDKSMEILEKHLDNPKFDVTLFSEEIGMSKTVIYKKMGKITDIGINDLMLKLRMKKASQLIIHTNKTIQEITILVGFKSAKYFSTCFKKQFSETPSVYRNKKISLNKRIQS